MYTRSIFRVNDTLACTAQLRALVRNRDELKSQLVKVVKSDF